MMHFGIMIVFALTNSLDPGGIPQFLSFFLSLYTGSHNIMRHFIWVFTICQSTRLGVSNIQRVNVVKLTGPFHIGTQS